MSFLFFSCLSLPVFAQSSLPLALEEYYQPTGIEGTYPAWQRKGQPNVIYNLCLDKWTGPEERIVAMCGDGVNGNDAGFQSGYFDLWFLKLDRVVSSERVKSEGRYGESGSAYVVKIGKRWGIVTESGTDGQGAKIRYRHFYLPAKSNKVSEVAWLLVHLDNKATCDVDVDCLRDELNTQVVFEENTNDDYPNMLIHSVGILAGKDVNVTQVVLFDRKNNRYNIPHFIQDPM